MEPAKHNETPQQTVIDTAARVLVKNYRQQPVAMEHGRGVELFDVAGNRYLDMTAGIAVCALGHSHPKLTAALQEQVARLLQTSNLYFVERQVAAAEAITSRSFADRVFFANSGAEANEAALKLARRYQHTIAGRPDRNTIISTTGSFHGRSMATVSVTGQEKYRAGFGPMFGPVEFVPFGDLDAAKQAMEQDSACAFIVEPIQAEGGINVPPAGYLAGLRALADQTGTVLIFDEVQTGIGRTGTWFGYEHDGVAPDVMTLAKALGGGVPIGAVAASEAMAAGLAFQQGGAVPHASTFGGNPLACAAAVAVIETIEAENLLENAKHMGEYLASGLQTLVDKYPATFTEIRGRGLLRGIGTTGAAVELVGACRERGLLLTVVGGNVIRFVPALIVETQHIDEALATLDAVVAAQES